MAQNLEGYTGEQTPRNVTRISRNRFNPDVLNCIGKDSGWNRWSVAPSNEHYDEYLALLGDEDDKWVD